MRMKVGAFAPTYDVGSQFGVLDAPDHWAVLRHSQNVSAAMVLGRGVSAPSWRSQIALEQPKIFTRSMRG